MGKKSRFLAVKKRYKRRKTKIAVALTLIVIMSVMLIVAPAMFFHKDDPGRQTIDGFGTVSYDIPTDGSLPTEHTGIENIGYMARRLAEQPSWYSEMHGIVDTMVEQRVDTYKQYSDGVLISTDISVSSLIKTAKQLCFVGDHVLWRTAADASKTDGVNTVWNSGEPTKVTRDYFKNHYGLPGTEFSVYILNEDTVLGAESVVDNGNGTYSQTFHLDPATDKAPYYYCQQMKQTGGLDDWPVFEYIDVTYTFDSSWQVLRSDITEKYKAKMVVSVGCTATYMTAYEYGTQRAQSSAYDDYFSKYANKPVTELPEENEITSVKCLTQAFGSVLSGPATFALDLDLNGAPVTGVVYVDIETMDIRARIGNIYIWYADDCVYLSYGDMKARMSTGDLLVLVSGLLPDGMMDAGASLDTDALVGQLGAGEFTVGGGKARLSAELELFGMTLPVDFKFNIDEKNAVTLDKVSANVAFGDFAIAADLAFSKEQLPALTSEQKAGFANIIPYVNTLIDLFTSDAVNANISYARDGFAVTADLKIGLKELSVAGTVGVTVGETTKSVGIAYTGGAVYLDLDGIKLSANVSEALTVLGDYITLPEVGEVKIDLTEIIGKVLSPEFAANFILGEEDGTLAVALKGTELLKAFGVDFALGEVALTVTDTALTANALGVDVGVTKCEAGEIDTNGYTDIVKYADTLADIFTGENLKVTVAYETKALAVTGAFNLNVKTLNASGVLDITYENNTKTVVLGYDGEAVYADLDGIRVQGSIAEILALVKKFVSVPEADIDANEIIGKVLAMNFGELISVGETDGALQIALKGTELLQAFGIEFALGEVTISVTDAALAAQAVGASVTLEQGEEPTVDTDGYVNISNYIQPFIKLFTSDALKVTVNYAAGDLTVVGTLNVTISSFTLNGVLAEGDVTVSYRNIQKTLHLVYTESTVYLGVDGIKIGAGVNDILALVKEFVQISQMDTNANEMIGKVLGLNFGELVSLGEANDTLSVLVKGTELLNAFGIDFVLGDVALDVTNTEVGVHVLGIDLTVKAAEAFTPDLSGYVDLSDTIGEVLEIIRKQAISFRGTVDLVAPATDETEEKSYLNLDIKEGALAWATSGEKTEIRVFLDATLNFAGTQHDIYFEYADGTIRFAYGNVGAEVTTSEFATLEEAFVAAYNRVRNAIGKIAENNPVPEIEPYIEQLNSMLALIKSGGIFAKAGESEKGIPDIVNKLLLGAPKSENGICTVGYGDFGIELLDLTSAGNGLIAVVTYEGASLRVLGDASVRALNGEFPAMPQGDYLTADDFAELLDYVATAVEMTTEQSITLNVNGSVLSTDTETYPDGKKYDFEATLGYYSGESFPLHIDAENYNAWVSTDAYLHAEINLIGYGEGAQSMWIDAYLADMDGNDELDLYLSVSTYEKDAEGSTPLTVLAPASELMTLISSALPLVGIDVDFVNKFLSEKWLDASTAQQLKAIGSSLMLSIGLGDLLDALEGLTGGEGSEGTEPAPATAERNGVFEAVTLTHGSKEGDRVFTVALSSEMIYGNGELTPVSLAITKSLYSSVTDENGEEIVTTRGYLSNIALNNVWMDGEGVEKLDMNVDLSLSDPRPVPNLKADFDLGSLKFSELIEALGLSATHKETVTDEEGDEQEEYALNDYFYIGGSAMLHLNLIGIKYDVPVKTLAVKVDIGADGEVSADMLMEFDQFTALFGSFKAFNGDTRVDFSLRKNMIYIKRTQTSGTGTKKQSVSIEHPEIIYRAMPLSTFNADMMNQIYFLFNLSDSVKSIVDKAVSGSAKEEPYDTSAYDLGALVRHFLKGISFTPATDTANKKWDLTVNGDALARGVLKDMNVAIDVDKAGNINGLAFDMGIKAGAADGAIDIALDAGLQLRNPQNIPCKVETLPVSDMLGEGMDERIALAEANDWKELYIDGQYAVISYYLADMLLYTQNVAYDAETYELFTTLRYPDLSTFAERGYTLSWQQLAEGEKITGDRSFSVIYTPEVYEITFVSEYPFGGVYRETKSYTYGDKAFVLPTEENETRILLHFVDENGNVYKTASDMTRIYADTTLTAVWELVGYDLTFVYTNEYGDSVQAGTTTAHFGDIITYPAVEREGYRLTGWQLVKGSVNESCVCGDATFEAIFEAISYTATLVSEYEMEGFVYSEDYGAYVATIEYCYNTGVKLPTAVVVRTAEGRFFLDGFKVEGENDILITLPNRDLSAKLLYAQWSEVAFEVKYVADGAEVLTQNYDRGAELSLPNVNEVAYKAGYTGEWGILVDGEWQGIANGMSVTAEMTIIVNYTPNVYQVRFISNEYVEAFDGYEFTYEYTYGTVYELPEYKIDEFDLVGYYTAANGKGDKVEIIENIASDITLYMYYVDNGVSVTYISGVSYADNLVMAGGAYEKEITLHDDYELIIPAAEGYIFLGWFRRNELENGGYAYTSVTEVGSDRGGAVDVYALWAVAAKVTELMSSYEAKSILGIYTSSTWSFNGKIKGGGYSDEAVSADIVEKLNGKVSVSVSYYVAKDTNGTGDKFLRTEAASNAVAQHSFSNSVSGSKEDKDFHACRAVLTYTYVTDAGSATKEFGSEYFARS